jgi:hypothetical protein
MRYDYAKANRAAKAKSHRCSHNDGLIRRSPLAEIMNPARILHCQTR